MSYRMLKVGVIAYWSLLGALILLGVCGRLGPVAETPTPAVARTCNCGPGCSCAGGNCGDPCNDGDCGGRRVGEPGWVCPCANAGRP